MTSFVFCFSGGDSSNLESVLISHPIVVVGTVAVCLQLSAWKKLTQAHDAYYMVICHYFARSYRTPKFYLMKDKQTDHI